eukprot:1700602-Rhodomonas_salina.2
MEPGNASALTPSFYQRVPASIALSLRHGLLLHKEQKRLWTAPAFHLRSRGQLHNAKADVNAVQVQMRILSKKKM